MPQQDWRRAQAPTELKFTQALDKLVSEVKRDRSILAAILCGSLSHDIVWAKSDIDLCLVTIDDRKIHTGMKALYAGGVNVHAFLMPRQEFRKAVEGTIRNSFTHALLAKGRLLYTQDPSIADLCASLSELGCRDAQIQLLRAATNAVGCVFQGSKMVPHTRRSRVRRPMDSLCSHFVGTVRGHRRRADR